MLKRILGTFLIVIALSSAEKLASVEVSDARQLLDKANESLYRNDIKSYERTLSEAVQAGGIPQDHTDSVAALANDYWRIRKEPDRARSLLLPVITANAAPLHASFELVRLELAQGNFDAARKAALGAIAEASEKQELQRAQTYFGIAIQQEIFQSAFGETGGAARKGLEDDIGQAFALLDSIIRDGPGTRNVTRLSILMSLLAGNGNRALHAWHAYYHIAMGTHGAHSSLEEPAASLDSILPSFTAESDRGSHRQIVQALIDSRLFPEAAVLASRWNLAQENSIRQAVLYARWCSQLSAWLDETYRRRAVGDDGDFRHEFEQKVDQLWQELRSPDDKSKFDLKDFEAILSSKFGAVIRVQSDGVNYGHIVQAEQRQIEQYGHKAQIRLLVLDSMISNSYTTWLWDGRASVGGWATPATDSTPNTVVEVRADVAANAWEAITDPDIIRRNKEMLQRWGIQDDQRAKSNPYSFLPGLRLRMTLRGNEKVLRSIKEQDASGTDLQDKFISEYERLYDEGAIFAHEGRHALDRSGHWWSKWSHLPEELEYRAKLSQVAFAPEPLIVMSAIFDSNIGRHGDPHGMANERIMKGLVVWMGMHHAEIKGLDETRPLLPQFDILTDAQMREAFRSMDPWSNSFIGSSKSVSVVLPFSLTLLIAFIILKYRAGRKRPEHIAHA